MMKEWLPVETAPKGGGAERVTDPLWVEPPDILLRFFEDVMRVGRWDWYYAEGGNGCIDGVAWVEPCSGELLHLHYGEPTGWMALPDKEEK